jgi:hypothetical protein
MILFKTLGLMMALVSPAAHAVPAESVMEIDGHAFSYFSNTDLTTPNSAITSAIIVVHGSERNAGTYYNTMDVLTSQAGQGATAVVIAPHFKLATDTLVEKELTFSDEGWLRGDPATNDAGVSSFDVMDKLLKQLTHGAVYPNLKFITITGHSAGGQLTQRFSLGTQVEYSAPRVHFRYLVVNPGSYLYLNSNRPVAPDVGCAFNDYKFGLEHLNAYQSRHRTDTLLSSYLKRDIVYLLGEADQLTSELDEGCEARAQGSYRFERGMNYKARLDADFPTHSHHLVTVPGIGHTEWGMYTSPNGKRILFSETL